MFPFKDLPEFVRFLESKGELRRVRAPVDPELEITEIACRVVKEKGPALLFENVAGSGFPLLINMFGTERRIEWTLGRPPSEIGVELKGFADDMMPPRLAAAWKHRSLFRRALKMKPRVVARGPVGETDETPDLSRFPILKCWPKDGGRFLTYPLVFTQSPVNGRRNIGIYRLHVFGPRRTGMHWQIERGGGFHYVEAESRKEPLPTLVVLGADPVLMLAGVLPLPEDMDELAFAGFLRGEPLRLTRLPGTDMDVPADAEIVLAGRIPPFQREMEGPFGDHLGHYSHPAPFPVFEIERVYRRSRPIYPAAVVGLPPQEDKYMGNAAQEMLLPLIRVLHPELTDFWAYYEAGFHNLAVAAVRQRYQREGLKTAFALLGEGQVSLTKCLVLVDPDVDVRRWPDVLAALRRNFDPREDLLVLPGTSQDTLDFTGPKMNLGSKMILDATRDGDAARDGPRAPAFSGLPFPHRNWHDTFLVIQPGAPARLHLEKMVRDPAFRSFKFIAAVGGDVPLEDDELLTWGIFSRFDCARDLVPAKAE
ncbi:MAG TPA: UbiD family decarboxylase, partial [Elusimicrobiota bacterium]|nr:UbiD family decarboxylase [Elusimicrobiota bacterium]